VKKDRSDVEHRRIDETEHDWTRMEEELSSRILKKLRAKDEQMPFDTGESHEEKIDNVQRIMKPDP
jgi:predicted RNA-binding protein (virulence factor B family)